MRFHEAIDYGKINIELDDDLEELRNLSFKEFEGERKIKEYHVIDALHFHPLKL